MFDFSSFYCCFANGKNSKSHKLDGIQRNYFNDKVLGSEEIPRDQFEIYGKEE
jgi:hypothetical protein